MFCLTAPTGRWVLCSHTGFLTLLCCSLRREGLSRWHKAAAGYSAPFYLGTPGKRFGTHWLRYFKLKQMCSSTLLRSCSERLSRVKRTKSTSGKRQIGIFSQIYFVLYKRQGAEGQEGFRKWVFSSLTPHLASHQAKFSVVPSIAQVCSVDDQLCPCTSASEALPQRNDGLGKQFHQSWFPRKSAQGREYQVNVSSSRTFSCHTGNTVSAVMRIRLEEDQ